MNNFILPLVINDRREMSLSLSEQSNDYLKQYIIEVLPGVNFSLLNVVSKTQIKSLCEGSSDKDISDMETVFSFEKNILRLRLQDRKQEKVEDKKVDDVSLKGMTYDDLLNVEVKKEVASEHKNVAMETKETVDVVGSFYDTIRLKINRATDGTFNLIGNIEGDIDKLLERDFPNLQIKIELLIGDKIYDDAFEITFSHPRQFLGIVLDFGSESSQLAYKRYHSGPFFQEQPPQHVNLFKNIYAYHKFKNWVSSNPNEKYYQEEYGTNYYKSIFFLKENLSGVYQNIEQELFIKDLQDNLKMLVSSSSRDEGYATLTEQRFHQLPNLKITHKYSKSLKGLNFSINKNNFDVDISLSEIKDMTYNTILRVILNAFLKNEFTRYDNACRKIRFILLVPNIYDDTDIRNTQEVLHRIFANLASNEYKDKILGWEVMTISESDASFLGYMNKIDVDIRKNSDYIIVDAGKGTTDFSVMRTGAENIFDVKPIYRNGLAGGGNIITYAVFETLLHYIRANAEQQNLAFKFIREKILQNLTDANLEVKNRFYNELERLKFNFINNKQYALSQFDNAVSGDFNFRNITESGSNINVLIDLLNQIENIGDFYGYVRESCQLIAHMVSVNLNMVKENTEDFNCAGVVLTGRGFMFDMLREEMQKAIVGTLGITESSVYILQDNELKDICVRGVFNNMFRINSERIGYPIQVLSKKDSVVKETEKKKEPKPKLSISSRLMNIFLSELNEMEHSGLVLNLENENKLNLNNLANSKIIIGSKKFRIGAASVIDKMQDALVDIVFSPHGYFVRKIKSGRVESIWPLKELYDNDSEESVMITPSLFPNYIDDKHIFSMEREDIRKAPTPPPPPNFTPNVTPPPKPKFF